MKSTKAQRFQSSSPVVDESRESALPKNSLLRKFDCQQRRVDRTSERQEALFGKYTTAKKALQTADKAERMARAIRRAMKLLKSAGVREIVGDGSVWECGLTGHYLERQAKFIRRMVKFSPKRIPGEGKAKLQRPPAPKRKLPRALMAIAHDADGSN